MFKYKYTLKDTGAAVKLCKLIVKLYYNILSVSFDNMMWIIHAFKVPRHCCSLQRKPWKICFFYFKNDILYILQTCTIKL